MTDRITDVYAGYLELGDDEYPSAAQLIKAMRSGPHIDAWLHQVDEQLGDSYDARRGVAILASNMVQMLKTDLLEIQQAGAQNSIAFENAVCMYAMIEAVMTSSWMRAAIDQERDEAIITEILNHKPGQGEHPNA